MRSWTSFSKETNINIDVEMYDSDLSNRNKFLKLKLTYKANNNKI